MDDRRNGYQVDSRFHFAFLGLTKPNVRKDEYTFGFANWHSVGVQRFALVGATGFVQDAIFDH
jgi:hypothetical protein